jgi:hypothetical protein
MSWNNWKKELETWSVFDYLIFFIVMVWMVRWLLKLIF